MAVAGTVDRDHAMPVVEQPLHQAAEHVVLHHRAITVQKHDRSSIPPRGDVHAHAVDLDQASHRRMALLRPLRLADVDKRGADGREHSRRGEGGAEGRAHAAGAFGGPADEPSHLSMLVHVDLPDRDGQRTSGRTEQPDNLLRSERFRCTAAKRARACVCPLHPPQRPRPPRNPPCSTSRKPAATWWRTSCEPSTSTISACWRPSRACRASFSYRPGGKASPTSIRTFR
jgi:hypothetical protein